MGEIKEKQKLQLQTEGNTLVNQSKSLMILEGKKYILKSEEEKGEAGILLKEAAALKKKINESYQKIWDAHRETGKRIKEEWEEQLEPSKLAYKILSQGIGEYDAKVKREAEEKARIERERIEKDRIEVAEEKLDKAKELKKEGTPESMVEALNLETEAEDIIDAPPPVVEIKQPEKISGIKQRRYVKCKIQDEYKLRTHILSLIAPFVTGGKSLIELLTVNDSAIRAYVKSLDASGRKLAEIQAMFPGLYVWEEFKATT